jgi:hypothetical protein
MRTPGGIFLLLLVLLAAHAVSGQVLPLRDTAIVPHSKVLDVNKQIYKRNDTVWIASGICKPLKRTVYTGREAARFGTSVNNNFSVHGNIQYDFLYRTLTDTPFYQKDFQQHSIKTNFTLLFKNTYPVQVTVLHRNSNSPYFRDITDVSVQFRQKDYINRLRENLAQQASRNFKFNYQANFDQAEARYKSKLAEVTALEQWLASPARLQELVAEKERALRQLPKNNVDSALQQLTAKLPDVKQLHLPELPNEEAIRKALTDKLQHRLTKEGDSVLARAKAWADEKKKAINDSIQNTQTAAFIDKKKKELEQAKKELAAFEKKLKGVKKNMADSLALISSIL